MPEDATGHRRRLKERFAQKGLGAFSDHEVLEFVLSFAVSRKDTKPTARRLIKAFGTLNRTFNADLEELKKIEGIGDHSALLLRLVHAAGERLLKETCWKRFSLSSPRTLYDYCRLSFGSLGREQFRVYFVNTRNQLVGEELLSEGTVDQAAVYPRTIAELALRFGAVGILLAHNHPSGDLTPSRQDLALTQTIREAVAPLGIKVHDHVIVSSEGYLSFHEQNLL